KLGSVIVCLLGAMAFAFFGHHRPIAASTSEADEATHRLEAFEAMRRSTANFAEMPTWDRMSGPDPYLLAKVPGAGAVGILRGADALVLLDSALGERSRVAAPASPVALAVAEDGSIYVAGELAPNVARFRVANGALVAAGSFEVPGVRAIRGLATGPDGWLYLVEEHRGHLVGVKPAPNATAAPIRFEQTIGKGPIRMERLGDRLIVDCLLDHQIVVQKLDASGAPSAEPPITITHDGPIWSFAAKPTAGGMLLALGGVEDHPLDRTVGAFGYIDSFLYVYRVDFRERAATREATANVSELGLVTPKAVAWATDSPDIVVAAYGSDRLARFVWSDGALQGAPRVESFVPGVNGMLEIAPGAFAFADPLLDAWVLKTSGQAPAIVSLRPRESSEQRDLSSLVRLGEALFFTTAMAPWNLSDGPLSRFTCETCHYEGYVDGRTHHTGRGTVHAVTKPLLGLFNNRPHFSRALDEDLATVAFNEFRVANARSGHDPWFELSVNDMPWLATTGVNSQKLSPELLRKGLMAFLMSFSHRPNPMALDRQHFRPTEEHGAAVFRDRCESCHEARLISDAADSRVPFDRWEQLVFSRQGPIVWGKAKYEKTGIEPYVHELGARVPSLRRLYKKRPYFTNGSAPTLAAVLEKARFGADGFWHASDDQVATARMRLADDDRRDLLEFLDLL
ncbi:MAG TPA: hypothetical protein VGL13_16065, partial [Polyangiaceae bacterium]